MKDLYPLPPPIHHPCPLNSWAPRASFHTHLLIQVSGFHLHGHYTIIFQLLSWDLGRGGRRLYRLEFLTDMRILPQQTPALPWWSPAQQAFQALASRAELASDWIQSRAGDGGPRSQTRLGPVDPHLPVLGFLGYLIGLWLNLCLKDSNPWTYTPVPGNTQLLPGSHHPPAQASCCLCHRCQIEAFGLFQSGTQAAESWRIQGSSSSVLAQSGQAVGRSQ